MKKFVTILSMKCQVCEHEGLEPIINLGYMPPVNWMVPIDEPAQAQTWLPTELMRCQKCELVQLGFVADPKVVFPPHYPYTSGTTKILRDNFENLAEESIKFLELKPDSLIIDIGSNDGTLLSSFMKRGMKVLGVEPTNVAELAIKNGVPTLKEFFNKTNAERIEMQFGKADLITCANCFAHMPAINDVVEGIKLLLKPGGTFVSESHYLVGLLKSVQYDTIYHEHLRYYSLASLGNLFARHGMSIRRVKKIPTHGGSVRVYASLDDDNVALRIWDESLDFDSFRWNVLRQRRDLISTVHRLKTQGRVVGIGAPSRASVVINYCRLDSDLIDYVCELPGSLKIGRYMPGTRIPVVDEGRLYEDQPEAAIVFSWHIFDEIADKLRANGYSGELVKPINI